MSKNIWITWEKQRRSMELAAAFKCKLFVLEYQSPFRYIKCIFKTFAIIKSEKPSILFVQNPSMVLASLATCVVKRLFNIPVIVDRHSNFLMGSQHRTFWFRLIFTILNYLTIKNADLTIITNQALYHYIKISGGNPFVLPDKLPDIKAESTDSDKYQVGKSLFIISSYAKDEPIKILWEAIRSLNIPELRIYISGNFNRLPVDLLEDKPKEVQLTGYIPDSEFDSILASVDAVMVLTTLEYVLLCGCYEAISAEKPLITSKTHVLQELFKGAIFVDSSPSGISNGIIKCFDDLTSCKESIVILKEEIQKDWNIKFSKISTYITNIK